jgi:hypothetical protein
MQKLPPEEKTFLPCFSEKQDETQPSERKLQQISNQLLQITSPKNETEKFFWGAMPPPCHIEYRHWVVDLKKCKPIAIFIF